MKDIKIGLIGAGNMGEALLAGILKNKEIKSKNILISDINRERLQYLENVYKIKKTEENKKIAEDSDVIILAVKPNILKNVLQEISRTIDGHKLIISIAAGISIKFIESNLNSVNPIIRVMPNTPVLVKEGAIAISPGKNATSKDIGFTESIFSFLGKTVLIEETLMDAVTGLSGSGPAYVFIIIEALADAGVKMGISRENSLLLAAQTILGSVKLYLSKKEHPGVLKDMVTSPGGTTIAGIHALEKGGIRATLMNAVEEATIRSREIGREMDSANK